MGHFHVFSPINLCVKEVSWSLQNPGSLRAHVRDQISILSSCTYM